MGNSLEDKSEIVVSESKEGSITKAEWDSLTESVSSSQDFLSQNQYESLLSAYKREGSKVLTKNNMFKCTNIPYLPQQG